jgi:hypothetical protein
MLNIETPVTRNFIRQILLNVQDFYFLNLLRSYLIKGLAIPLVGIKYPTISTNLLKQSNRRKGE